MSPEDDTSLLVNWRAALDERQTKAVAFARVYADDFAHGAVGHNDLLLIAKLSGLLDHYAALEAAAGGQTTDE